MNVQFEIGILSKQLYSGEINAKCCNDNLGRHEVGKAYSTNGGEKE